MHPYLASEFTRLHQAEIRRQADHARLARMATRPERRSVRIKLGKFWRGGPITTDVRRLRPA